MGIVMTKFPLKRMQLMQSLSLRLAAAKNWTLKQVMMRMGINTRSPKLRFILAVSPAVTCTLREVYHRGQTNHLHNYRRQRMESLVEDYSYEQDPRPAMPKRIPRKRNMWKVVARMNTKK